MTMHAIGGTMPNKATDDNSSQSIDEFDNFDQLARKLMTVSKGEIDALDALRKAAKLGKITPPKLG